MVFLTQYYYLEHDNNLTKQLENSSENYFIEPPTGKFSLFQKKKMKPGKENIMKCQISVNATLNY